MPGHNKPSSFCQSLPAALFLLCLLSAGALAAGNGKPVPMDAAAASEMPSQAQDGNSPALDSPPPGGAWSTGDSGSWSLDAQESKEKEKEKEKEEGRDPAGNNEPAADDPVFHSGYWSSTGNKPNGKTAAVPDAAAPVAPLSAAEDTGLYEQHSTVVTSIQKCYDQLDPATVAEIKKSYVKPYEECQRRLAEQIQLRNYAKAGQLQDSLIPETPRNYVRVQNNPTAP